MSQSIKSIDQQTLLRSSSLFMNQTVSNSKVESTSTWTIPLTNRSNDEPNNTIHFRNPYENQIMKEPRISVARRKTFFWPFSIWRFFGAICLSFLNWNNRLLYYWLGPTIHNSILKVCPKFQGSKSHFSEVNDLLDEPQSKKLEEKIVHSVAP